MNHLFSYHTTIAAVVVENFKISDEMTSVITKCNFWDCDALMQLIFFSGLFRLRRFELYQALTAKLCFACQSNETKGY